MSTWRITELQRLLERLIGNRRLQIVRQLLSIHVLRLLKPSLRLWKI